MIKENDIQPLDITAQAVADMIIVIRNKKLPDRKKTGTAGSFFKNPIVEKNQFEKLLLKYPEIKGNEVASSMIKLSAGQLIELAGCKGKTE